MRGSEKETRAELPITHTPLKRYLPLLLVFLAAFFGIAWILIRFTDSNVPWLDSFTTALSIIGMWMLARKYVEQWWAWIVVEWYVADSTSIKSFISHPLFTDFTQ